MALPAGDREIGPDSGSLRVNTFREGVAARVGHDLVIEVTRWRARIDPDGGGVELDADPRSLEVREGLHGVKPLTDKDRRDIERTIDDKVLGGQPIEFRSSAVRGAGESVTVEGALTMAGATRPIAVDLTVHGDGRATATVVLRQSDWGITPYRGLMGALRVRDDVEVVVDAQL